MERLTLIFILNCISLVFPHTSYPHQIRGEVTPLMNQMEAVISLIEANKIGLAFKEVREMLRDSHYKDETRLEEGLGTAASQIDKRFKTDIQSALGASLAKRDSDMLKKTLQKLGALLMLEKFNSLEAKSHSIDSDARKSIFWSGRNYFSLVLEPALEKSDPAEEMRMDRLLDRMLYRLEDRKWEEFRTAKIELIGRIEKYFSFSLPSSLLEDSTNSTN